MALNSRQRASYTGVADYYERSVSGSPVTGLVPSTVAATGWTKVHADLRILFITKPFENKPSEAGQTQKDDFFTQDEFKVEAGTNIRAQGVLVVKSDGATTFSPTRQYVVSDMGRERVSRGGRRANDQRVRGKYAPGTVPGV